MTPFTTRLATDEEGQAIKALMSQFHEVEESVDFSRVAPFWIVAEMDGKIVGCVQTCISRPFGNLENLHVQESLGKRYRAKIVERLLLDGCATLRYHGATHVTGFVPDLLVEYRHFLTKRGTRIWDRGAVMMRRVV